MVPHAARKGGLSIKSPYALPPMPPLEPLRRISPSQFSLFKKCKLRACWKASHVQPLLPKYPSTHIGTVIHKVLEMAGKGEISGVESFNSAWSNCITQEESKMSGTWLERHLVPLDKSARNYEVKKQQCLLAVKQMFSNSSIHKGSVRRRKTREIWLQTNNGNVGGYVDAILPTIEGDVVIDYKTGQILEASQGHPNPEVKEDYQIQLKLYAALYYSKYGKWPASLKLIGIDGTHYSIQFDPESCLKLLEDANKSLNNMNFIISNSKTDQHVLLNQISSPTPKNCIFCKYRPCCPPYWDRMQTESDIGWPNDVKGTIKKAKMLGNGRMLIKLALHDNEDTIINIRGLHPERHPGTKDRPDGLAAFSMISDSAPNSYKEGILTTIYSLDD